MPKESGMSASIATDTNEAETAAPEEPQNDIQGLQHPSKRDCEGQLLLQRMRCALALHIQQLNVWNRSNRTEQHIRRASRRFCFGGPWKELGDMALSSRSPES